MRHDVRFSFKSARPTPKLINVLLENIFFFFAFATSEAQIPLEGLLLGNVSTRVAGRCECGFENVRSTCLSLLFSFFSDACV